MKKTNFLLMILLLLTATILQAAGTEPSQTGGVYQVSSKDHLLWICTTVSSWSEDFAQTQNISFSAADFESGGDFYNSGNGFSPIGNTDDYFSGSYDGNSHTIDGIEIYRGSEIGIGFFGIISSANLTNIILTNISVEGNSYSGGLVGGSDNSSIDNCSVSGSISANSSSGGLIGYTGSNDIVSNCYSDCTVNATGYAAGGLTGYHGSGAVINNCYSKGSLVFSSDASGSVGGLIGECWADIEKSYSSCNSEGKAYVGGLIGYIWEGTITNCYSMGNVTRTSGATSSFFGGFAGYNESNVQNCYSIGNVYYEDAVDTDDKGFLGGGVAPAKASYSGNFFDSDASNQDYDNPDHATFTTATAETTSEMTNTSYTNNIYLNAGWDFKGESENGTEEIWNIGNERNLGYPYFDWEYPGDDPTLPVTLSFFTAIYNNNTLTLSWETNSEQDNLGWYVYRNEEDNFSSSDLISQDLIPGNGTTSEPSYYSYADNANLNTGQTYYYWLESIDFSGEIHHYNSVVSITIPAPHEPQQNPQLPIVYQLNSSPNPMRNCTKIEFTLDKNAIVSISIYNIKGELVNELPTVIANSDESKSIYWNGEDKNGRKLSSGIYLYQLKSKGKIIDSEKLIIVK